VALAGAALLLGAKDPPLWPVAGPALAALMTLSIGLRVARLLAGVRAGAATLIAALVADRAPRDPA
jgi:hypothetical protein